jgi:hypothetical protein
MEHEPEHDEEYVPVEIETADGYAEDDTTTDGTGQYVGGPQDG